MPFCTWYTKNIITLCRTYDGGKIEEDSDFELFFTFYYIIFLIPLTLWVLRGKIFTKPYIVFFAITGKYLHIRRSILFANHFLKSVDLFATGLEKKRSKRCGINIIAFFFSSFFLLSFFFYYLFLSLVMGKYMLYLIYNWKY